MEVRTGAAVTRLHAAERRVEGVILEDGETLEARRVVASCDPKQLFLGLMPRELRPRALEHAASAYRARGTAARVDLALSGYPDFTSRPGETHAAIRIGETFDELERASDAAKYGEISERPMLEVHVPTLTGDGLAPAGHHVFSILVHFAPYHLARGWTEAARDELLQKTVDRLAEHAPGVRDKIVGQRVLTPLDLEKRYGVTGGHMHHGEHAPDQLLVRPFAACRRYATPFEGLFLAGSGTHPGGGMTCAPGALAADVILDGT